MFTDRFKKIPIEIFIKEDADIVGEENAPTQLVKARIDPNMIVAYRPDPGSDKKPGPKTVIEMLGGHQYAANINIIEFEKLMNA